MPTSGIGLNPIDYRIERASNSDPESEGGTFNEQYGNATYDKRTALIARFSRVASRTD
jgi:hypothetical protein